MSWNRVSVKVGGMRVPDECVVMLEKDGTYMVQGNRLIGRVNPVTGKGAVNWRGSGAKYFVHLNEVMGAEVIEWPADLVDEIVAAAKGPGDRLGPGVYMAGEKPRRVDVGDIE